jgi:hypothetical protein
MTRLTGIPRHRVDLGVACTDPNLFCRNDAWYRMLKALGFEHFGGDDDGVTFTFPALCPKAAQIALMLAGYRDEYRQVDEL